MEHCETCSYWMSRQTNRPNAKGNCFRYPQSVQTFSNHGCGEHKFKAEPADAVFIKNQGAFGGRPQLMKQLKEAGIKPDIKWTVAEMKSKLEEANERQKAEATNGQGEEGKESL